MRSNKLLGQHFLTCGWVLPELAQAAELTCDDTVLEIGPGTGVLTRFLAARAKKVIAVEKDQELSRAFSENLARKKITNVDMVTSDILRMDFSMLPEQYKVVANIPYYLTSRLIRTLLELDKKPQSIVLTIQQEVAERATAEPPNMNILALSIQSYGSPEVTARVPASCFNPKPKVDSAILRIANISQDFFLRHNIEPHDFFRIVRAGFSSRRKMLVNNLEAFTSKKDLMQGLFSIGHPGSARAQELSCRDWASLTHILAGSRN